MDKELHDLAVAARDGGISEFREFDRACTIERIIALCNRAEELDRANDRLGVLAVKWCDIEHQDWDELTDILGPTLPEPPRD